MQNYHVFKRETCFYKQIQFLFYSIVSSSAVENPLIIASRLQPVLGEVERLKLTKKNETNIIFIKTQMIFHHRPKEHSEKWFRLDL